MEVAAMELSHLEPALPSAGSRNWGAGSAREAGDMGTHKWGEQQGQGAQPCPKNPSKPPLLHPLLLLQLPGMDVLPQGRAGQHRQR